MTPEQVGGTIAIVFFVSFIVIMGFDTWLYTDKTERNSITQVIIDYSHKYPIIAWFLGFFMGFLSAHFYG